MAIITVPAGLPAKIRTILQPDVQSTDLILTETPFPVPNHPDDVLVRVATASPCRGELLWAKNFPQFIPADRLPVPCQDLAGTVVAAPDGSGFAAGDRVFCRIDAGRPGSGREYTIARVSELAKVPDNINWVDAAAVPLSSLTAWQALFVQGTLDAGALTSGPDAAAARERNGKQRVLITGAAGGVGSWAIQLAALAGAGAIVAVCGTDKEAVVRGLGATDIVDYHKTTVADWVAADTSRQVDLVVDMIGGETLAGSWSVVKDGGALISVNTPPDMVKPKGLSKELSKNLFFVVEPSGKNLAEIAVLVEAGKVKPLVDSVWEIEQFKEAFDRVGPGHAKGKAIIKIDASE